MNVASLVPERFLPYHKLSGGFSIDTDIGPEDVEVEGWSE